MRQAVRLKTLVFLPRLYKVALKSCCLLPHLYSTPSANKNCTDESAAYVYLRYTVITGSHVGNCDNFEQPRVARLIGQHSECEEGSDVTSERDCVYEVYSEEAVKSLERADDDLQYAMISDIETWKNTGEY